MGVERILLPLLLVCFIAGSFCTVPVIVEHPVDATIRQGDDVTLKCVVEHLPSNDLNPVQWTKGAFGLGNDRNLSSWERYNMVGDISIGEYNLHIANAKVEDEDVYECQVTLHFLRSKKAKLTVQVPPTGPTIDGMKNDGLTVNVVANKENSITCRATGGKPAAHLQWYRNGIKIAEGVTTVESKPRGKLYNTSSTLRITPTADDADASYACVMSSEAQPQVERKMMRLEVRKPPIVSVALPPSISAGDYVRADCRAVADPPVISYRWFVNGMVKADQVTSTFDIKVVNKSWHEAVIGCQAKNDAGYSERNEATIDVKYPPQLLNSSSEQTVDIGDKVTMWCSWDSNPPSSVVWTKAGNDEILGKGAKLTLSNVTQEDAAMYVCYASAEKIGSSKWKIPLNVRGPPLFASNDVQYAVLGKDALIKCALKSHPGITSVAWTWTHKGTAFTLRDNDTLTSSGNSPLADDDVKYRGMFNSGDRFATLHVTATDQDDLHSYSCAVQNNFGSKSADIALKEDTTGSDDALAVGMLIGGVVAAVVVLVIVIAVAIFCIRSRRQRKSTNFDKEMKNKSTRVAKENVYTEDEAIPINHKEHMGEEDNVRSSMSSRGGIGVSSVDGSDDSNPTPTSGQDDGYHTEEANSWNRSERRAITTSSSTSPTKSSMGAYEGYRVHPLPSPQELDQPLYSSDFGSGYPPYQDFSSRPMSPYAYDPNAMQHSASALRSQSALGDRFSPPPHRYVHRAISDAGVPVGSTLAIAANGMEFYPAGAGSRTPVHGLADPSVTYMPSPYAFGNRTTSVPQPIAGAERYYQMPVGSSQSSLDKFERGSALSASAIAARAVDPYENAARMSNLSSRLSQSSRSSDFLRPFTARMATHV